LTLSPPREISRTAVNQLALPYCSVLLTVVEFGGRSDMRLRRRSSDVRLTLALSLAAPLAPSLAHPLAPPLVPILAPLPPPPLALLDHLQHLDGHLGRPAGAEFTN
jgi:hypothetical protein